MIRFPELRVVDAEGEMLGVLSLADALAKAKQADLDLIVIAPAAVPPVAKITDYGQFLYQKKKEEQKNKAKQKKTDFKLLKLSLRISDHDAKRIIDKGLEFTQEGHKVRFELNLRGREKSKKELALRTMQELLQTIGNSAKVEQPVTAVDNAVTFTITSKK